MKSASTGAASGCLVWVVTFGALAACLCPTAAMIGSLTSTVTADQVAPIVGPWLCPEGTTPHIYTYATTISDDTGVDRPATGYGMDCRDASGEVVQDVGPTYGFVWVGVLAAAGLGLSALLAFVLAAPAAVIVARVFGRNKPAPP